MGQILKMSSATIKKPQTVYAKKIKGSDAFKGLSSQILDNIHAEISTLLLHILAASFKDALVGIPVRKLV